MLQDYLSEFAALQAAAEQQLRDAEQQHTTTRTSSSSSKEETVDGLKQLQQQIRVDATLRKLKRCLSFLDMEFRLLPRGEQRQQLEGQLLTCRRKYEDLQRQALLLGKNSRGQELQQKKVGRTAGGSIRGQQLQQLARGQQMVEQSCRLAAEAEAMGDAATSALYVQRETLSRALSRSSEANKNLQEADSVLTKLSRWWWNARI